MGGGPGRDNRKGGSAPEPASHVYDVVAERDLMRSIREACGLEIAEATKGDRNKAALLAAITANESGGSRQAYRFEPDNLEKLRALLAGTVPDVDGLKKEALEKKLAAAESELARVELLKKLAGLHGYTLIPGYYSIAAKSTLEGLTDKNKHFHIAAKRLDYFCKEYELDPAVNQASLGRCWNTGHPNGRTRSALYSWRLQERIRLYLENEGIEAPPPEPEQPQMGG
jgi:hypothetical protein